jgi:hypothetical protein
MVHPLPDRQSQDTTAPASAKQVARCTWRDSSPYTTATDAAVLRRGPSCPRRVDGCSRRIPTVAAGTKLHVSTWLLAPALLAAVVLLSPPALVDPDTLSHLAAGRVIVETGTVPLVDPFTFPCPTARWHNPEWLADVLWFRVQRLGGEAALQGIKLAVIGLGLLLTVCWAVRLGAPAPVTLLLLLALLPAAASRFTVRNDVFAFVLIPLYGLLVEEAHERPLAWAALLPVGWLWANLHASFVLGWLVIAAALLQRVAARRPVPWRWALPTLLVHPLLPLLGPEGAGAYVQLWDHAVGASTYREAITEWKSPLLSRAHLALLPLHLCALAGVVGLLRPTPRPRLGVALLVVSGFGLAYVSRRFIPFVGILSVPAVATLLAEWGRAWRPSARLWTSAALGALVLGYLVFAVRV